jgi:hypothetical protein
VISLLAIIRDVGLDVLLDEEQCELARICRHFLSQDVAWSVRGRLPDDALQALPDILDDASGAAWLEVLLPEYDEVVQQSVAGIRRSLVGLKENMLLP